MKPTVTEIWKRSALWLAAAALASLVLATRLELSFDLSAFFPQQTTLAHDVLIEQLRTGPASRLLVIGLNGSEGDALAEASDELKQALAANPAFVSVQNGEFSEDTAQTPEPVYSYYLLMRDLDYSRNSLQQALQSRLQDLAFGGGTALLQLIARDPFLVTLDILERLTPVDMSGDMWFAADGSAVLMAETHAPSIDIAAQTDAVDAVHGAFAALPDTATLELEITGVGAFSVELQQTIRAEAAKRSMLATGAVLLVLLLVFRRPRFLLLAALPIATGFLAGLTLVSLLFDTVHGITLAFGFTLLGIAVDYPLHLFSHAQSDPGRSAIRRIWPTMRLGVISTAIAYLALAFSGSQGLAQLGIFTAAGVIVAVLATRTWLPLLIANPEPLAAESAATPELPSLHLLPSVIVLAAALFAVYPAFDTEFWDDNLAALSPVPAERLLSDRDLRSAVVTPDLRYQLVLHNESLDDLLRDSQEADRLLAEAVGDGLLENWQSVSLMLPSQDDHERRQQMIPEQEVLRARLGEALADTPFHADAFEPFLAGAQLARTLPPLTPEDVAATQLRSWLDSHLLQIDGQWVALISVVRPAATELAERVRLWDIEVSFVDLQAASAELMRDYRHGARNTILVAALLIIALLWYVRGQLAQTLWIGLTVTAAVAVTIAVISTLHGSLTVIHLVALLLVLGLGLDYALFMSRSESPAERRATDRGVLACAASTTLAFSVLAGSPIPVLKFLGLTVATGSAASFVLAWSGSRLRIAKADRAAA